MAIEGKFKGIVSVDNYVRLLITGNPDWLVPAGIEERRFAVLDVGDAHRGDHAYFAAIEKQMNEGGREALLDYLLGFDLAAVNLRQIPKTATLRDQKIASLSPEMAWLLDFLCGGRLPWGCNDPQACPRKAIYDSYIEHAKQQRVNRRSIETAIGMFLAKTVPQRRPRRPERAGVKVPTYVFPPLAECRKRFDGLIQGSIDWGSSGGDFFDIDEWEKEPPPDR
jgi:hypothetical protein